MPEPRNWYVITGGPSTGKSSLLAELAKRGHATVEEAARTVIDEGIAKGQSVDEIRQDEKKFQEAVARLKQKTEKSLDPIRLTFFDRGMHDTIAYMKHYGFSIADWIHNLMQSSRYKKVFLLEPLNSFESDYARTEDQSFIDNIHQLLHDAYASHDLRPIIVPNMSLEDRTQFILDHVETESA